MSKLEEKGIKFALCGSISKEGNNRCYVLYEGVEIFCYHKKIPFELKYSQQQFDLLMQNCFDKNQLDILKKIDKEHDFKNKISFEERLKPDIEIHVIDINNLGRIFTYICKDIDDDNYLNICKILQGDFVFLPACSPSIDLINNAKILAERYHCTTTICNTCSALIGNEKQLNIMIEGERNIGFIVTPSKDDTKRSFKDIYYSFNNKCLNCKRDCMGHLFQLNMKELSNVNGKVNLDIKQV